MNSSLRTNMFNSYARIRTTKTRTNGLLLARAYSLKRYNARGRISIVSGPLDASVLDSCTQRLDNVLRYVHGTFGHDRQLRSVVEQRVRKLDSESNGYTRAIVDGYLTRDLRRAVVVLSFTAPSDSNARYGQLTLVH